MREPLIRDNGRLVEIAREKGIPTYSMQPDLADKIVVVAGNGTSLLDFDFSVLRRDNVHVAMANDGFRLFPDADTLMCSDRHWLHDNSYDMSGFHGDLILVTRPEAVRKVDHRMRFMRRGFIEHCKDDPLGDNTILFEGHNSTSTNIALAIHRGAKKIVLLGIDLAPGADGRRRAVGERKDDNGKATDRYKRQAFHLKMQSKHVARHGVLVYNCSPRSVLRCYPYARLEDVL